MDDVVLAETTQKNAQKLLNITNDTSQRYHVEFGMPKTKYLRAVKAQGTIELKLGERTIEETDKYVYLGEVNNKKMNLQEQIKKHRGQDRASLPDTHHYSRKPRIQDQR